MARIRKRTIPKSVRHIKSELNQKILDRQEPDLSFSFKYFQETEKFHINRETAYFRKVIDRLRNVSCLTKKDITANRSSSLRSHPINWGKDNRLTEASFGIPGEEDLCDESYQFNVSSNEYGRLVGFFTDEATFNIVWFDKDHQLYSSR